LLIKFGRQARQKKAWHITSLQTKNGLSSFDRIVLNDDFIRYSITVSENQSEFSGLKVMVIDDSNTIRRTAETLLSKAGCEVLTADNGFEALPVISSHRPDILFIDIMMPRLDGYQTCALVKNNPRFSDIPIIMLSSKDGLFDRAKGRVVGAEQYLTKPFTRDDLLGAIRQYLLENNQDAN
jgi:twitching motility two-component system response regulator PilG